MRGFAGDQRFLRERCRDGTDRRVAAKNATVESHFYSFTDPDGNLNPFIEDTFVEIEGKFPGLRDELKSRGRFTPTRKRDFDLYVAYSLVRTRTVRDQMRQISARIVPVLWRTEIAAMFDIDLTLLKPETLAYFDQFSRCLSAQVPTPEREVQIRELRTFVYTADLIAKDLRKFAWKYVEFAAPCLVTSDAGVGVIRASSRGGLLPHDGIVVMPLSPTAVAVGRTRQSAKVQDEELARAVNRAMTDGAYEQVLLHPDMEWPSYLRLDPTPPEMRITVSALAMGPRTVPTLDPDSDLERRYQSNSLYPFSRKLMNELIDALPMS